MTRFPVGVTSRTYLANLPWDILDTWPYQRNWDLSVLGEVARHSGFYD